MGVAVNNANVDAEGLAAELRRKVRGEVRFDDGALSLYATDASNYRQIPIGVVLAQVIWLRCYTPRHRGHSRKNQPHPG